MYTPCQSHSIKQIFDNLQKSLIKNDFAIDEINYEVGLMVAKTEKKYQAGFYKSYYKEWRIFVNDDGTILSKARLVETIFNKRGITTDETSEYMGNNTPDNYKWYWDIKSAIENLCQSSTDIKTLETDDNGRSFDVWEEKNK